VHDKWFAALETNCWFGILGPPGIASRSKRPFTLKQGFTCADWITFTKVTGKYLYSQLFQESQKTLETVCTVLDFFASCLDQELTTEKIELLKTRARKVAGIIHDLFPRSERSLVLHHIVCHIPDQLARWGPARCCWAFPFERSAAVARLAHISMPFSCVSRCERPALTRSCVLCIAIMVSTGASVKSVAKSRVVGIPN